MNDHSALRTERLALEPVSHGHVEAFFAFLSDPQTLQFWHAPPHASIDETRTYIGQLIAGQSRAWAIVPNGRSDAVGLVYYLSDNGPVGMGYILHRDFWGRGIAREATEKVLGYGFGELGFDRIELWIDSANARSLALADRLDFVRRGAFPAKYAHRRSAHENVVLGLYAKEDRTHPRALSDQFYSCVPIMSVPSVSQAIEFYRDKLGFHVEFMHGDPPAVARLYRSDWSGPGARVQVQASRGPMTLSGFTLYFEVGSGIDALCDQFRQRGALIERGPETMAWGRRQFALRDCNGVLLQFATPV